eukprot:TRINITY_DN5960_c0_g1_i2.p2 TRINITY_DN5960_c0_g1~~TRINITY_DN5960_c0_g1_i2.p2  ORF type:complete len:165 (+),score=43.36 TRINITY_DN5960_c0_g1_i2:732-1226(+)
MKLNDGMFLNECREVAKMFPTIQFEGLIVDNCCMQLVSNPSRYDVLVMPNMYGNIISNLCSGLIGGVGFSPGWTAGDDIVVFEQGTRHVGHDLAGKNLANPTAMLLSASTMLRHLDMNKQADVLDAAICKVLTMGKVKTTDAGGSASLSQFKDAICHAVYEISD